MLIPFDNYKHFKCFEANESYPIYNKIIDFVNSLNARKSKEWFKGFFIFEDVLYFTILPHFNGKDLYLFSVYVDRLYRKKGYLKKFMKLLFDFCDKENMKIYIDPNPLKYLEDPYISKLELESIYKRYGFLYVKRRYMVKNPNDSTFNEFVPI